MEEKLNTQIETHEDVSENKEEKQEFDYRKQREERIKSKVEKAFLSEFGAKSMEDLKKDFKLIDDYRSEIDDLKNQLNESKSNGYKLEALKSGIDEEFIDYVADKLQKQITQKDDFKSLLGKFKAEHPRYLKQSGIKINTSPNFENSGKGQSFSEAFNGVIKRKIKER